MSTNDEFKRLQEAIWERCKCICPPLTWDSLAEKHGLKTHRFRRALDLWATKMLESQPVQPSDTHSNYKAAGRPQKHSREHENVIADAVRIYADINTPLIQNGIKALV